MSALMEEKYNPSCKGGSFIANVTFETILWVGFFQTQECGFAKRCSMEYQAPALEYPGVRDTVTIRNCAIEGVALDRTKQLCLLG